MNIHLSKYFIFFFIFFIVACNNTNEIQQYPSKTNEESKIENIHKNDEINYSFKKKSFKTNEVLVKFKNSVNIQSINSITEELNLSVIEINNKTGVYRFKTVGNYSLEKLIRLLENKNEVEFAEPNYTIKIN